jgi:glycine/D-amino acid oxidase-like deaminating enzyme
LLGICAGNRNTNDEAAMKTLSRSADTAQCQSVWAATAKMPSTPKLSQNVEADVCIVGAGIAGLTTGYLLTKAGKRVVLVEDGSLAGGMTQVTTAHLSDAIDDHFTEIERWHGERGAFLAADSHTAAINRIETIASEIDADCDFRRLDGYLFLAPGDEKDLLDHELAAARRAGLMAEMVPRAPLSYDTGPAIRFPNQARFHPLKYLAAMARAIQDAGGRIYTDSHADYVEGGERAKVEVGGHTVRADAVVVATNTPINDRLAIHTKQAPYMSYVIGVRVPRGSVTRRITTSACSQWMQEKRKPADTANTIC